MPTFDIKLDGDGVWPELGEKARQGKLIHLGNDAVIGLGALAGGMSSGRASVAFRFDLPDGGVVLAETSLRALYTATKAIVIRHGEDFMQDEWGLRFKDERERKMAMALQSALLQLVDAKRRLGEPFQIDATQADAELDRIKRIEEAARRLDAVIGEFGGSPYIADAAQALHDALHPSGEAAG
jgi:hypothetical protein